MAKLILKNVFKRYENKDKKKKKAVNPLAVNNFSLETEDGEFIGILGPSGCGKTTSLRMIAGLEDITDGEIYIGDMKVNDVDPKDRGIGLAFEDYALYPPLSVYDNIAFNLKAKNVSADDIKKEIDRIAPMLKVEELLEMRPAKLSGGQKQRVNLARAIIRKPKLLLLDEPMSHLDGKMRQVLRIELQRLHKEIKCTTIIVTHDQLEAMSLADRIAIMKDGELQQFGTPLEVYDNPVNEFVAGFIGEPPMNINTVKVEKTDKGTFFKFVDADIAIPVPDRYLPVVSEGMKVRLGVRPTDLMIGDENSKGSDAKISVFENLGEERKISFRVGTEFLTLVTPDEKRYKQGDPVKLEVKADKTHLFDVETGEVIRAK
ncbi:ABC transporter ATP-binding protein [Anaerotalea alkaliphila]|uniref:ABC transporter ATP-binding protein n=1 Tax=Anaerotalea alkaliphila TaxID=2662126 RepID=A0A7X5HW02_9FIRM|nr:ABC transporter ATP-binding protein [Anaerotalea alkaliphila]NDL67686.1 ABC transporter ATP-binding protein [Anaerotalea alkaliphila]